MLLNPPHIIPYSQIIVLAPSRSKEELIDYLQEQVPSAWVKAYKSMCSAPTNVLAVRVSGFEYMFDYSSELLATGHVVEHDLQEDRVVAAHGISQIPAQARNASRIRGFPSDVERGDRGHFLAHSVGGGLEVNIFHQAASLNRGWSASGKVYRSMERYCSSHPGTFFFTRPIYHDQTARPTLLEFGILKSDRTMWIEVFANRDAG